MKKWVDVLLQIAIYITLTNLVVNLLRAFFERDYKLCPDAVGLVGLFASENITIFLQQAVNLFVIISFLLALIFVIS